MDNLEFNQIQPTTEPRFKPAIGKTLPLKLKSPNELDTPIFDKIMEDEAELRKKSSYSIQMDLRAYKDLELRNYKNPIRGGVLFKSPLKLVNFHASCTKCHYALEIDAYGRGCIHNCSYCYAKEQLTRYGYWNRPIPVPLNIVELHKTFYTIFETDKPHKWREVLSKRIPLRIGSMSDSFMWMDQKYGVALEMLKLLNHYKYPYLIFTRSDLVAEDAYMKAINPKFGSVQMSMSSINDNLNKKIEPGAPSAKRRLLAMKKLSENGIWTSVRINPLFPMRPDGYFTDPNFDKSNTAHLDFFSWDIVDAIADHKIPTFLAGVVRLNPVAMKQFSISAGIDYSTFFRKDSLSKNGDKRFSDAEIGYYYKKLKTMAQERGIRFSTCYIGNGEKDYFQYQSLWDNKQDCCDARGKVPAIQSSSQDIPEELRKKFAPSSVNLYAKDKNETSGR